MGVYRQRLRAHSKYLYACPIISSYLPPLKYSVNSPTTPKTLLERLLTDLVTLVHFDLPNEFDDFLKGHELDVVRVHLLSLEFLSTVD